MSTGNIEEMINKYFDEELTKNEEIFLFSSLSQDEEAREYFKKMSLLKNAINETKEDFPLGLEEKILYSLEKQTAKRKNLFTHQNILLAGSYAVTIILIVISVYLFYEIKNYKEEVDDAVKVIMDKSATIELLLNNTLPAAEVKGGPSKPSLPVRRGGREGLIQYLNEVTIKPL